MAGSNDRGALKTPPAAYVVVAGLSVALGFWAVYAILKPADKSLPQSPVLATGTPSDVPKGPPSSAVSPPGSAASATQGHPLATGEMLTFVFRAAPEPLSAVSFQDAEGRTRTLADFKGKVVLLNLWATWCAPCRREMPALDRLQASLGGPGFEVLALSLDRQGIETARKFLSDIKAANLAAYVEPSTKALGTLKVSGLPTSILIDREGREIGRLAGPAEWDSADAKRLIEATLK